MTSPLEPGKNYGFHTRRLSKRKDTPFVQSCKLINHAPNSVSDKIHIT